MWTMLVHSCSEAYTISDKMKKNGYLVCILRFVDCSYMDGGWAIAAHGYLIAVHLN